MKAHRHGLLSVERLVLTALPLTVVVVPSVPASYVFVTKWGCRGSGEGQFLGPGGVATDGAGNVYVADSGNDRIQKFTSNGTFLTKWGYLGVGRGEFQGPWGIATDAASNVYVAEAANDRIQVFTSGGRFLTKWGSRGTGLGEFWGPSGIATDGAGNVYVAEAPNHRIQKFTSSGTFLSKWGSYGKAAGDFHNPRGVAVSVGGNVYVADSWNNRIQVFTSSGTFLTKWGGRGVGPGEFQGPWGIATDAAGNVYVADRFNHRVQKFTSSGTFLTKWGTRGSGQRQFDQPSGIATDGAGNVYVAESLNCRIQKFAPPTPTLSWLGATGYEADGVDPDQGTRGDTRSRFKVLYSDADGHAPRFVRMHLRRNGKPFGEFAMVRGVGDYEQGRVYRRGMKLPPGHYEHRFRARDRDGLATGEATQWTVGPVVVRRTAVALTSLSVVSTNAGTQITFSLSSAAQVQARILNIAGRPVRTLCHAGECEAGTNTLLWNAQSDKGLAVPNGTYLAEVTAKAGDGSQTRALGQVRLNR